MKKQLLKSTAVTATLALALSLAACGGASSTTTQSAAGSEPAAASSEAAAASETPAEPVAVAIDKDAFDALLASGPVADDAAIEANAWAKAVK